jgi:hypothetical protein
MIQFRDGRYFEGVLYCEIPPDGDLSAGNLLGAVYSDDPERKEWVFIYRFRYYVDDDLTSASKDTRHWFKVVAHGAIAEHWAAFCSTVRALAVAVGGQFEVALMQSDLEAVQTAIFERQSYVHPSHRRTVIKDN